MPHPRLEFFYWSPEGECPVQRHLGQWRFSFTKRIRVPGRKGWIDLPDKTVIVMRVDGKDILHFYLEGLLGAAITRAGLERYDPR